MAEGAKNRFNAFSDKDTCDETNGQSFEKMMAEVVEEALNSKNDQKAAVSVKQPTRAKKKTGQDGGDDRAKCENEATVMTAT